MEQWTSYYDGPNSLDDDPTGIALQEGGGVLVCGESNRTGSNFKFIVTQFDPTGLFAWEWVHDVNSSSKAYGVYDSGVDAPILAAGEGEGPGGDQDFIAVGLGGGSAVGSEDVIPGTFGLSQNYPNPFNPSTSISYTIANRQQVVLKIYDLLGSEVATLVNGIQDAGKHEVTWNATGVPSGVYFYRLSTNGFVQTRKLLLLR